MRRRLRISALSTILASSLMAAAAHAEVTVGGGDVPAVTEAPMGKLAVRRGVQGPAGLLTARLLLLVNASKGFFGEPTSLAPDIYYSLTDSLQIGLLHTDPMGWQSTPGVGLCLSGTDGGCPKAYQNVGFDVMYGLLYGDFHLSVHSSLYVLRALEPTGVMWTVGFTGKFHFTDVVALFFDPQLGISLSEREIYDDQLFVPIELQFQTTPAVAVKVLSGIRGPLTDFADTYAIPLGLGVVGNVSPRVDLGLRFSFDNLLGKIPAGPSRADRRSIGLLVNFRI